MLFERRVVGRSRTWAHIFLINAFFVRRKTFLRQKNIAFVSLVQAGSGTPPVGGYKSLGAISAAN